MATETADAVVDIRDLRVRRGRKLVLPGVSLQLHRGVVTGLLGPSGSGKTTLMRAIVGVQIVDGGTIDVLGRPAAVAPGRRDVRRGVVVDARRELAALRAATPARVAALESWEVRISTLLQTLQARLGRLPQMRVYRG